MCGIVRRVDPLADAQVVDLGNFEQADAGLHHDFLQLGGDHFRLGGQEHEVMDHREADAKICGGGRFCQVCGEDSAAPRLRSCRSGQPSCDARHFVVVHLDVFRAERSMPGEKGDRPAGIPMDDDE